MGILEASQPGSDKWWRDQQRKIDDLQRQLDMLRASVGSAGQTFTENGIVVKNGGGLNVEAGGYIRIDNDAEIDPETGEEVPTPPLLHVGGISGGHEGILMRQADGKPIFIAADDGVSVCDGRGNDVLATDRGTGYGLSSPIQNWAPQWYDNTSDYRYVTTDTFTLMWTASNIVLRHPFLRVHASGTSIDPPASGTFQVRIGLWAFGPSGGGQAFLWDSPTINVSPNITIPVHELKAGMAEHTITPEFTGDVRVWYRCVSSTNLRISVSSSSVEGLGS